MKTPEEIKKGLTCVCDSPECEDCAYATKVEDKEFGEILQFHCSEIYKDAYDLIIHLESRLAQVERERDAAVADIEKYKGCGTCKFQDVQADCDSYQNCCKCDNTDCPCYGASVDDCWQWRGVCEENTKEESH